MHASFSVLFGSRFSAGEGRASSAGRGETRPHKEDGAPAFFTLIRSNPVPKNIKRSVG